MDESRSRLRVVGRAGPVVGSLSGRGRSPGGTVRAKVGGDGLLESVRLSPDALRQGASSLAGEVREAVRSAQRSYERQAARPDTEVRLLEAQLADFHDAFAAKAAEFQRTLDALAARLEDR